MRYLALAAAPLIALTGCAELSPSWTPVAQTEVLGRTWEVSQNAQVPDLYRAQRDNNNLNPFGKPAMRRTPQAIAALRDGTGCQIVPGSLYQDVSAYFYAKLAC
jgi:hypothetical protein